MENMRFNHNTYMIRRKVLRFIGASFHIYNEAGGLEFFVNKKGFKLKEDIRVFTGEDMTQEVLTIRARNVVDFSATYDVFDPFTGEKVGGLRRKGLKSILKDEWLILDANDNEIGVIKEDSAGMAIIRRFLTNLVPQHFYGTVKDQFVFDFKQNFNPFVLKITMDFSSDSGHVLDRRLGVAAGILLSAIEGRQN